MTLKIPKCYNINSESFNDLLQVFFKLLENNEIEIFLANVNLNLVGILTTEEIHTYLCLAGARVNVSATTMAMRRFNDKNKLPQVRYKIAYFNDSNKENYTPNVSGAITTDDIPTFVKI